MADSMSPCVVEVEIIRNLRIKEGLRSASCVLHLCGIFGLNYRILWMMVVMPQPTEVIAVLICPRIKFRDFKSQRKERLQILW